MLLLFCARRNMDVIWKYLDKRSATIAALKDYESMQFILRNTSQEIVAERERMTSISSPGWQGKMGSHSTDSGQNRMIQCIEEIDVLKERYRQAVEYMEWFDPAWRQLSEDERFVLDCFYLSDTYRNSAAISVAEHYSIEQASAYRKKNRALEHLTVLLFGKY